MSKRNPKDRDQLEYNLKKLDLSQLNVKISTEKRKERDECPICLSSDEKIVALECNHKLCERCICRLSVLLKTQKCPVCKQENIVCTNKKYLTQRCTICKYEGKSLVGLLHHYKSHKIIICEECVKHKNEFSDEFVLYNIDDIQMHKRKGTQEENKHGFYGHIFCHFCKKYFYDADECKKHCRKAHFLCTVCESIENRHQYYNNHADLNLHLREMHYVCDFSECNGISFAHQIGLAEHLLKIHKIGTGSISLKKELRKATVLPMAPYEAELKNAHINTSLDTQHKKLLKPLQNISKTVPCMFNRTINKQEIGSDYLLSEAIKKKYPTHYEDLLKASNLFIKHELSPEMYLEKVEIMIGDKETIRFADEISRFYNDSDQNTLRKYLKSYKNQVLFPKFVKSDKKDDKQKKESKGFGYKMFEIKKSKN